MKLLPIAFSAAILFVCTPVAAKDEFKPVGDPVSRSVDLVFRENPELMFRLTPRPDLEAGVNVDNRPVAFFSISAKSPMNLGIRWTPNSGIIQKDNFFNIKIPGKNNPKNQIKLGITGYHGMTGYEMGGDHWAFLSEGPVKVFTGIITIEGDQSVTADTYTISLDAAAFVS